MAWLSVPSTSVRNMTRKNVRPTPPKGFSGVAGEGCGIKRGGRLAIPVTTMNFKKFPENTDQARLKTWPIRKSLSVKRPAGNDASVMGPPGCSDDEAVCIGG